MKFKFEEFGNSEQPSQTYEQADSEVLSAVRNLTNEKFRLFYSERQFGIRGQAGGEALRSLLFTSFDFYEWDSNKSFRSFDSHVSFLTFDRFKIFTNDSSEIRAAVQWGVEHQGSVLRNILSPIVLVSNQGDKNFIKPIDILYVLAGTKDFYKSLSINQVSGNDQNYRDTLKAMGNLPYKVKLISLDEIEDFPGITCSGKSPNRVCKINS